MKLWIRDMAIALIIGLLLTQLIKPTIVREHSMEATLQEYDYIILNRQAYLFSEPKVGDIIVFHTDLVQSNGKEKLLIKRVIGLPGDRIFISDGKVYRNGEPLDEPYTLDAIGFRDGRGRGAGGQSFCNGDNRRTASTAGTVQ